MTERNCVSCGKAIRFNDTIIEGNEERTVRRVPGKDVQRTGYRIFCDYLCNNCGRPE